MTQDIKRRLEALKNAIRNRQFLPRILEIEIWGDRGEGQVLLERKSLTDDNGQKPR